jgi:hypothetical protein
LTPVTLPQAPPVELVQSLFDLTPRASPAASPPAKPSKTSPPMAAFRRTPSARMSGCNRQVDIVALLTAISPTRLTHPS